MKKLLALVLTLVMVCGFCGCGGNTDDVRGEITGNSDTTSGDNTEENFAFGTTNGGTYKNEYLGLTCTLPDGWQFYTDEQILELNNLTSDLVGDELSDAINNANVLQDMYAQNTAEGCNLTMALEKHTPLQVAQADLEQVTKSQISILKSSYETMGYTDVNISYQKLTVDGKQYDALRLVAKIQGMDFYGFIFTFKKNAYIASVAFGSLGADKTASILECFEIK